MNNVIYMNNICMNKNIPPKSSNVTCQIIASKTIIHNQKEQDKMTNKAYKIYIVYPTLILSTTSIEARVCVYIYI